MHLSLPQPRGVLKSAPSQATFLEKHKQPIGPEIFRETHQTAADGLVWGQSLLVHEKPSSSKRRV